MAILDRFRAQPRQKHPDAAIRLAFVDELPIDERSLLTEIAREDEDARVRRAAVMKLMDPTALAGVAASDADPHVREAALLMLRDIALDAFEGVAEGDSMTAVGAIAAAKDVKALALVARTSLREDVARRALQALLGGQGDARAVGSLARHAVLEPIRLAAFETLADAAEIIDVALNSEFKDTAVAAVERLSERVDLESVATRGRNKSASKRARGVLREMDERAAAAAAAEAVVQAQAAAAAAALIPVELPAEALVETPVEAPVVSPEDTAREEAARAERDALAERERIEADAARQRQVEEVAAAAEVARVAAAERAAREAEAREKDQAARREGLARVHQLFARVEPLVTMTDMTLKAGERALRDVRAAQGSLPPLPTKHDHDDAVQRLKAVAAALTPKVLELREAVDWQRWANVGVQEKLCARMEALVVSSPESPVAGPEEIAKQVRELQQQWRAVADVPRPQGEALWRRFKTAHDAAWALCEAHFAAEAAGRVANLAKKTELCVKAESVADSTNWIQTADEIKRLQAEWKTVGPVSRGQEKAVWERFRSACDRFFTRRHADLSDRKKVWGDNLAKKEALCVRVEALAASTEWEATSAEIKRLQGEWKTIGPVKKSRSEPIWQRFRAACDVFFARYAGRHDLAKAERVAAREALCVELEALAVDSRQSSVDGQESTVPQEAPADLALTVRGLRSKWQQEISARGVDRDQALAFDTRFRAAFAAVLARWPQAFAGSDLDPETNRKRMETLVRRVEDLAASVEGRRPSEAADAAMSPTVRMAAMLKEALAANTIGGKVDEGSRMRAAAEEVGQAQASWARIGPVAEDQRRALTDRFQRACRRITEKARTTGRS